MYNKMNKTKTLAVAITIAASAFVLAPPSFADDNACTQDCEQVFKEAQKLPSPDADSIKDYLKTVTDAGMQCLQCAVNQIQGQSTTDNNQSNDSSGSSSSNSSSQGPSSTDDGGH